MFHLVDDDSRSSSEEDQIDHLIFFIHGVGGVCDVRFRSCVEVVADFRKMANNLLSQSNPSSRASTPSNSNLAHHLKKGFFRKHSTESGASSGRSSDDTECKPAQQTKNRRVECLPISWHSCTRRQTGMNDQLNLIALNSVPKLRHFFNKIVMDALLYTSGPVYSQTIINNVGEEINRIYTLFMEKHPNFTGTVSLAGHSLGSVIVFDLLAHQWPFETLSAGSSTTPNNNNESSSQNQYFNTRQNCRNVSHLHHDLKMTESGVCTDYKNLEELLKDMDLVQYSKIFHKEKIDIDTLLLLSDLDMKELNLPLGVRRKLGTYINFKKVSLKPATRGSEQNDSLKDSNHLQQQKHPEPISSESNLKHCNNLYDNKNTGQCLVNYPQLKFKPKCFFSFGSPMPMFLSIRGIQNISKDYKLPTCDRMLNIFHPYDPLAYRIEPLIDPRFKNVEPVQVPHHRGGKRMHVQLREGFARVGYDLKHRLLGSLRNTWTSFTSYNVEPPDQSASPSNSSTGSSIRKLTKSTSSSMDNEAESMESSTNTATVSALSSKSKKGMLKRQQFVKSRSTDMNESEFNLNVSLKSIIEGSVRQFLDAENDLEALKDSTKVDSTRSSSLTDAETLAKSSKLRASKSKKSKKEKAKKEKLKDESLEIDTTKIGQLNGGRRLDYVLQEKPIELFNEYIFAFTSHANYWQNEDSALIILNEIYRDDRGIQMFDYL